MAANFKIPPSFGDIAQLGERLNGIQEVVGSIPIISTKLIKQGNTLLFLYLKISILAHFSVQFNA